MYLRFPGLKGRGLWARGSDAGVDGTHANTLAAYDVVRIVLGLVLLTAAALKGHQLATEPVAETSLFTSRWFLIGVVEFELFFGLWLLAGLYPRSTWTTALLCFGGFACVSLYKALSGEATCGCFGKVPVNPWYTFTLDALAVAALLRWQPAHGRWRVAPDSRSLCLQVVRVGTVWLLVSIPAAVAMGSYQAATLGETGDIFGDSGFVVLEPETWSGKRFPLRDHIDIGGQLTEGKWIVLLYHHDCPHCKDAVPEYVRLAQDIAVRPNSPRVALIEMPPYASPDDDLVSRDSPCVFGRLSDAKEWFVATPVCVAIEKGRVVTLGDGRFVASDWLQLYE